MGIRMYGPTRWAAMKNAQAPALGWSWSDIGSGIFNIGKAGVKLLTQSEQAEIYKAQAAEAQKQAGDLIKEGLKWAAIIGIGVVAANALRG